MRPGLVVVGAAFLAVAAASATALVLTPTDPSAPSAITSDVPMTASTPNQTRMVLLSGTNGSASSFTVRWHSTERFQVELYEAPLCETASLSCVSGGAIAVWPSNLSGNWTTTGWISFPFLLEWTDASGTAGLLGANATCLWVVHWDDPIWSGWVETASTGALAFIGAIVVFLGVFVRGGIYRRPPRSGEDGSAAGEGALTAPRTGSPDGGSGSPRRGPSAPPR